MNYIYALTNVDFDKDNKDVVYFKNQNEKDSYFNLSSLFDSTNKNEINFEKRNLLNVTITIATNDSNKIDDEFGYNYCIIKEINKNDTPKYYFYFIDKIMYDNLGRMRIGCNLDIFTTYFDKLSLKGLIKRATFREFEKDQDTNEIVYNANGYTHIFSVDDTYQGKKFIQKDKVLQPHIVTNINNATIDYWLENNVECWQYLYVDCYHTYKHKLNGAVTDYRQVEEFLSRGISTSYGILVQPIYKTNKNIFIKFTDVTDPDNPIIHKIPFTDGSIDKFRTMNNDNAYIYSCKLSKQPPFTPFKDNQSPSDPMEFLCNISLDSGDLIFDFGNQTNINDFQLIQPYTKIYYNQISLNDDSVSDLLFEFTFQTNRYYNNDVSSVIESYIKTRMTKAKYISVTKEFWKFPNATSLKNIELKITYNGQEYSTSPSKIDSGNAIIEMQETLSPDLSKTYVRWKPNGTYAFRNANNDTITGGVFSDDTSVPLGTSNLQQTLAQSKNFFLQKQVNVGANFLLGLGSSIAKQDAIGVVKGMAKTQLDEVNYGFELDNIENVPSHLQKASGNALFNLLTKEFGLHLEIWMMTAEDLENIASYYDRFGESSNTISDNIFDFIEKHKYYDYVEMDVFKIGGMNLSMEIKDEFMKKFKRGVRFWYTTIYDYSKYNYERSLE